MAPAPNRKPAATAAKTYTLQLAEGVNAAQFADPETGAQVELDEKNRTHETSDPRAYRQLAQLPFLRPPRRTDR